MYRLIKKPIVLIGLLILTALMIGGYIWVGRSNTGIYTWETVVARTIKQSVTATGQVHAASDVTLSFDRTGKVAWINGNVGTTVHTGDVLVSLDSADARATLAQAVANRNQVQATEVAQQFRLDKLKHGTRPEQLQIDKTAIQTATQTLSDAKLALSDSDAKGVVALLNLSHTLSNTLHSAQTIASSALTTSDNILGIDNIFANDSFKNALNTADIFVSNRAKNTYSLARTAKQQIDATVSGMSASSTQKIIQTHAVTVRNGLSIIQSHLVDVSHMLDTVLPVGNLSQAQLDILKASITIAETNINTGIVAIDTATQSIATQKSINAQIHTSADTIVHRNIQALKVANDILTLAEAGATTDDINAQTAMVKQALAAVSVAQAGVASASAMVQKTVLVSPFDGVITLQNAKIGQTVVPSSPIVSVISTSTYQMDVYIPEVNIGSVKIGQHAQITLDSYGSGIVFPAIVTSVDPGETMTNNIPSYKVILQFVKLDSRIKSGMTGNVTISIGISKRVLAISDSTIIHKEDTTIVILKTQKGIKQQQVTVGSIGSDGYDQVIHGLKVGDQIATFGNTN